MKRTKKRTADMNRFKTMLLAKRNEILVNVFELKHEFIRPETNKEPRLPTHPAEVGTDNFYLENTVELLENEREILKDIDYALECMEQGTYGFCQECHEKVSLKRLQAIPWARFCVRCAYIKERTKPTPKRNFFRMRKFPY